MYWKKKGKQNVNCDYRLLHTVGSDLMMVTSCSEVSLHSSKPSLFSDLLSTFLLNRIGSCWLLHENPLIQEGKHQVHSINTVVMGAGVLWE